jgi:hypothetical protein
VIEKTCFAVGSKVPVSPDIVDEIFDRTALEYGVDLMPWCRTVEFNESGYMVFVYVAEIYP